MRRIQVSIAIVVLVVGVAQGLALAQSDQNFFASIYVGKQKIGQVHLTTRHNEKGEIEELKTRASMSILGLQVYHHAINLHEVWKDGDLHRLWGHVDINGTAQDIELTREAKVYQGRLNQKREILPHNAFPASFWHHAIVDQSLLFTVPDFQLLEVKVADSQDTVRLANRTIPANKYVFSGDWQATLWFDHANKFLKAKYKVKGRNVVVVAEP